MNDDIDFLNVLDDDLRAAATEAPHSRSHKHWLAVAAPLTVAAVVAVIAIVATQVHGHGASRSPISPRPPVESFGGPVPLELGYRLNAVVASGPNDVWAFGVHHRNFRRNRPPLSGVILHYNGTRWSRVQHPPIGEIRSAAIDGPNDVWAAGGRRVLHWTGSRWLQTPLPPTRELDINSMSASDTANAWLVGSRRGALLPGNSLGSHTVAMHWNGHRWSVAPTPNFNHRYNDLSSVLATSPTNVWALGQAVHRRFALRWNGSGWHTAPAPIVSGHPRTAASALSNNDAGGIWAVGSFSGGYGPSLYFSWNGQRWIQAPGPGASEQIPAPSAVSGSDPQDLWAVGSMCCDGYVIARPTRGRWHDVRAQLPTEVNPYDVELGGVATVAANDAWAVGYASGQNVGKPVTSPSDAALILHWDGTSWAPVAVPGLFSIGKS